MKKTLSVASTVLTLLFRGGAGWGLLGLVSAVAVFMFFFSRSDGVLLDELQIRVRYSFYFAGGLLSLATMYIACVTLCHDLDGRQLHTLAAAPVHRAQLWLGKYLGVLAYSLLVFLGASLAVALCCALYIHRWDKPEEKAALKSKFFRAHYCLSPSRGDLTAKVDAELKRRRQASELAVNEPISRVRYEIALDLRRQEQTVNPNSIQKWQFTWDPSAAQGKYLVLRFKFYSDQKRASINGVWTLDSPDASGSWAQEFKGFPFAFHELRIPLSQAPNSRTLRLTFENNSPSFIIFQLEDGLSLLYDNGGIVQNYARMALVMAMQLATLAAVALALASLFTYSVAVFATIAVYCVGMSTDMFAKVITDLQLDEGDLVSTFFIAVLKLGVWLTQGVRAPDVVGMFSEGVSIPLGQLFNAWGGNYCVYLALTIALGVTVLTKKELDKLLRS